MTKLPDTVSQGVAAFALIVLAGSTAIAAYESDTHAVAAGFIPFAQYTSHLASSHLEGLHRIQINDIAGLRTDLEHSLANDIRSLWASIQNERTSSEERQRAYGLLRLIAVQGEKFPVSAWNGDAELVVILRSALENDAKHADLLRRQDWSKPKWVNWVN